jgi:glycosyltransferase involved in cell wall biosynthesis
MYNNPQISLIIPAYNEEKTIGRVLEQTCSVMEQFGHPFEIIAINDCSTDETELAIISSKCNPLIISNQRNRGKGYCIRKGVEQAKGSIIITLDSDGEHNPREIPLLLAPILEGVDIVAGSRFLGTKREVTTKLNQIGNHLFNLAIMLLTGKRITDSQTGFRALKKHVFCELNLESDGYEIETEITVKSLLNGFSFKEVPINVTRREHSASKLRILPDSKKIFSTIFKSSVFEVNHNLKCLEVSNKIPSILTANPSYENLLENKPVNCSW